MLYSWLKLGNFVFLLNSRIHIEDKDFALEGGLLPDTQTQSKVISQFRILSGKAGINKKVYDDIKERKSLDKIKHQQVTNKT